MHSAEYHRLQANFADALSDRKPVPAALAQFAGDGKTVAGRIALYRGNVLAARSKALQAAYPVIAKIVGEEFFGGLARAYMQAHPSTSGDLNGFGAELSRFIAGFKPADDLPYLADVARLEWALHTAHYAADRDAFDLAAFAAIPADRHAALRFVFHPAAAFLQSDYPLARIWEVHQDEYAGEFSVDFDAGPCYAVVQRPQWKAEARGIDAAGFAFLHELARGETLGAAVEAAFSLKPDFDLGDALQDAIAHRLIVDCS
jgi:uncharacterized protein